MKKLKLLTSLLGIFLAGQMVTFGVDATFSVTGATITNLIPTGCRIFSLQIVNNGTTTPAFAVIDSPPTNTMTASQLGTTTTPGLTYSNVAYFTLAQVITNITRIVTNFAGVTNNNITVESNVLQTVTNTVAASAGNTYRVALGGTLAAGPGTLFTMTNQMSFLLGLTITNATTGTNVYNISYSPNL